VNARAYIVAAAGSNYASLIEACRRVGVDAGIGDDPARIAAATHVIVPGVGAADHAMRNLRRQGLDRVLRKVTQPLLGICLGMQILFEHSDEGDADGLGLLRGDVRRLPAAPSWPHMGWNTLARRAGAHPLLDGIGEDDWFYFVHGYAAPCDDATLAETHHGGAIAAVVARANIHGVQFHPEKSAAAGRRLLANFFALT
jgi:imidazole glycerol-phosphate synthase subunit HisH